MMDKKKLGMAAAVAVIGTVIGISALAGTAAHAQSAASITITGMAQGGTVGSPTPEVLVSVTCPAGDQAEVSATATQGGFYTGHTNEFTCTGNPQNQTAGTVALSGTSGFIFAGPVSAGASLWIAGQLSQDVGTTATVTYP
jgi:hypothetical protein